MTSADFADVLLPPLVALREALRTGRIAVDPLQLADGPGADRRAQQRAAALDLVAPTGTDAADALLAEAIDYLTGPAVDVIRAARAVAAETAAAADALVTEHQAAITDLGRRMAAAGFDHVQPQMDRSGWIGTGQRPDGAAGFAVAGAGSAVTWEGL